MPDQGPQVSQRQASIKRKYLNLCESSAHGRNARSGTGQNSHRGEDAALPNRPSDAGQDAIRRQPNSTSDKNARERPDFLIRDHRGKPSINGYCTEFQLLVNWRYGELRWEEEHEMHRKNIHEVERYWLTIRGGRAGVCHDEWDVLRIHRKLIDRNGKHYLVEWVGSSETRWQAERYLEEHAPGVLEEYRESQG